MDDIFIYITALPPGMNEAVLPCSDGYTIYINDALDDQQRAQALSHAMKHIYNNDFRKEDVQKIEMDAHANE